MDRIAGKKDFKDWSDISKAFACIPSKCEGKDVKWDVKHCLCTAKPKQTSTNLVYSNGSIPVSIERNGKQLDLLLKDHYQLAKAGDKRKLAAGPELTLNPFLLGFLVFIVSLCVIGTHGLLSGTATMDFGGRKGAATAVGMIDGFVYLGTAVQSFSLGYLTSVDWMYWPIFLFPFGVIGFYLLTRIWHAKPKGRGGH